MADQSTWLENCQTNENGLAWNKYDKYYLISPDEFERRNNNQENQ